MDSISNINLNNAPETSKIVIKIIEIIEYMLTDEIKNLKLTNYKQFVNHMYDKEEFHKFIDEYFSLFAILIEKKLPPIELLYLIISSKAQLESGKCTKEEADNFVSEYISNKYVYPSYGGKDKFEKHFKNLEIKK